MPKETRAATTANLLKQPLPGWLLPVLVALYITVVFNNHIYHLAQSFQKIESATDLLFYLSIFVVIFFTVHLFAAIFAIGRWMKPWLIFLLLVTTITSYPRDQYTVVFDEIMVQNIIETDAYEAGELLSLPWVLYVLVLGGLPTLLIAVVPVRVQPLAREIFQRLAAIGVLTACLVIVSFPFRAHLLPMPKTRVDINEHIAPTAFLYSAFKYFNHHYAWHEQAITPIGTDAVMAPEAAGNKHAVLVIVVGESARTANLGLAGYPRNTTPLLQQRLNDGEQLLFFPNVEACGTSTVISIPCIFSPDGSRHFSIARERHRESLLDLLAHAGFEVVWIDNNSGCKGVCARVRYIKLSDRQDDPSCNNYNCADILLARALQETMATATGNLVVVLHQKGSHGPAYYRRISPEWEQFTPTCLSNRLQECSRDAVVNSYDNTILYTDYVLDRLIKVLEQEAGVRDTALLYISDHGESLGENGLYLHGLPEGLAPEEQTRVPAMIWLSAGFRQRSRIDYPCLRRNSSHAYSHDHIFHTVLGLLGVETAAYKAAYDITSACRPEAGTAATEPPGRQ